MPKLIWTIQNSYWHAVNGALILLAGHVEENRAQESKKLPFIIFQGYPEGKL